MTNMANSTVRVPKMCRKCLRRSALRPQWRKSHFPGKSVGGHGRRRRSRGDLLKIERKFHKTTKYNFFIPPSHWMGSTISAATSRPSFRRISTNCKTSARHPEKIIKFWKKHTILFFENYKAFKPTFVLLLVVLLVVLQRVQIARKIRWRPIKCLD